MCRLDTGKTHRHYGRYQLLSVKKPSDATPPSSGSKPRAKISRDTIFSNRRARQTFQWQVSGSMAARVTQNSARVLRVRQSAPPLPPAHRGPMLSSLIWSLSTPSASLPYLKPPCSTTAFTPVIKRGIATAPKSKHAAIQESEDESLARFQRAVRDEHNLGTDIWSLPIETLGASTSSNPIFCLLVHGCGKKSYLCKSPPSISFLWKSRH
jgi:hypothetical protein